LGGYREGRLSLRIERELDEPGKVHLDSYLKPFIRPSVPNGLLAEQIAQAPGLDGNDERNEVLGKVDEPALKARYEQQGTDA